MNQKQLFELIAKLTGAGEKLDMLYAPAIYVQMLQSITAAILLHKIIKWQMSVGDKNGWFFHTYDQWKDELYLSEYEVRRLINGDNRSKSSTPTLKQIGVETKKRRVGRSSKLHYRVNLARFIEQLTHYSEKGHLLPIAEKNARKQPEEQPEPAENDDKFTPNNVEGEKKLTPNNVKGEPDFTPNNVKGLYTKGISNGGKKANKGNIASSKNDAEKIAKIGLLGNYLEQLDDPSVVYVGHANAANEIDASKYAPPATIRSHRAYVLWLEENELLGSLDELRGKTLVALSKSRHAQWLCDAVNDPKKRIAKPLSKAQQRNADLVQQLCDALGIKELADADYGNFVRVAKAIDSAGHKIAPYVSYVRQLAREQGGWTVTVNSLITNGRLSSYDPDAVLPAGNKPPTVAESRAKYDVPTKHEAPDLDRVMKGASA